jgi:hypothetical protein
MYMGKLEDYEIEKIDLDLGLRLIILCNHLRIHSLLQLIILKVIMRKMTIEKCLHFLHFSAECSESPLLNEIFKLIQPVEAASISET